MDTKLFFIFVSSATVAFSGVTSLPTVQSCSSTDSIQQAQQQCYTQEGLQFNLGDGTQSKQSYLDAALTNTDNIQELCSELDAYKRATVCAMQVALQCLTRDYWDYFPSASNLRSFIATQCDNLNVTNLDCVKSVSSRMYDCGYSKGREYGQQKGSALDTKDFLCYAFAANAECQLEVLPTCGCPTTKLYVQISKLYLNPTACSPITVKTPVCDPRTQQFIGGATMLKKMPLLVLSALVLCALWGGTAMI